MQGRALLVSVVIGCGGSSAMPDAGVGVDGASHDSLGPDAANDAANDAPPLTNIGGELVWVKQAGGTQYDSTHGLAVLADGSWVVTGRYGSSAAVFGGGEPNMTTLPAASGGEYDVFLARYNVNGTLAWVKRLAGGPGFEDDVGTRVYALSDGTLLVGGSHEGTLIVGTGEPNETTLPAGVGFIAHVAGDGAVISARNGALGGVFSDDSILIYAGNGILARYTLAGTQMWSKSLCTFPGDGSGMTASAALADGTVLVAGTLVSSPVVFGAAQAAETTLTPTGTLAYQFDAFIAKLATNGDLMWARRAAIGAGMEEITGLAAFADGSFVVSGTFGLHIKGTGGGAGTATFGPDVAGSKTLAHDAIDAFIARYDANGALTWVRRARGAGHEFGTGVVALPDGSSTLAGLYGIYDGPNVNVEGTTGALTLPTAGISDTLVAHFDAAGQVRWARHTGGDGRDEPDAIAVAADGSTLVSGRFAEFGTSSTFGAGEPNQTTLTPNGQADMYFAKLAP